MRGVSRYRGDIAGRKPTNSRQIDREKSGSQRTRWWREVDSNHRFRMRLTPSTPPPALRAKREMRRINPGSCYFPVIPPRADPHNGAKLSTATG